jgi:uncharacterized peroxidase-related enzyme
MARKPTQPNATENRSRPAKDAANQGRKSRAAGAKAAAKAAKAPKSAKTAKAGRSQGTGVRERYPLPDLATLPDDIRDRILGVQEKSGFVPNVFLKLARRPPEFRAFFAYYDALMLKEGGLSKGEREMIVVATSALNNCLYCVVAHGAILRIYQKDPLIADQIATNYRKAALPSRQRAMLDFACKVALSSATVDDEDHRLLQAEGFDDDAIWDIAAIAAFFALSNRIANFSGMMPNEEFYAMARTPPSGGSRAAR